MLQLSDGPFDDDLRSGEETLTEELGRSCRIFMKSSMDEESIEAVQAVESRVFRPELRYGREELVSRGKNMGFVFMLVKCSGEPIAFIFGYTDSSDGSAFYLDTVATIIEGRHFSSILIALLLLRSLKAGYKLVTLRTEETDEKGRELMRFYERLGFKVTPCPPSEGVGMCRYLDPESIKATLEKAVRVRHGAKSKGALPTV